MSSLQQTPAAGQVAPPPALIDGVSQQQVEAAVKKHVRQKAKQASEQQSAYELALTITLNALCRCLKALNREDVASPFESGKQADADAAWAMDWVTKEVTQMAGKSCAAQEFEVWLCQVGGAARCAYASLTNKETIYARLLARLVKLIDVFGEMLEDAEQQGQKFFLREVVA